MPSITGVFFFFFNDTATTEIYTLSLHDALPIFPLTWALLTALGIGLVLVPPSVLLLLAAVVSWLHRTGRDRKSTRLNSSHANISYAVFCLKKKTNPAVSHCVGHHRNLDRGHTVR